MGLFIRTECNGITESLQYKAFQDIRFTKSFSINVSYQLTNLLNLRILLIETLVQNGLEEMKFTVVGTIASFHTV